MVFILQHFFYIYEIILLNFRHLANELRILPNFGNISLMLQDFAEIRAKSDNYHRNCAKCLEFGAVQRCAKFEDLEKYCKMKIWLKGDLGTASQIFVKCGQQLIKMLRENTVHSDSVNFYKMSEIFLRFL